MPLKMGITVIYALVWLLTALTLTTQELVRLRERSGIHAECGKPVTLNCDVSSSRNGLEIKHMEWFVNNKSLCSVNSHGQIHSHRRHTLSDFHCTYKLGELKLTFQNVHPDDSGNSQHYRCKLQSNKGVAKINTTVELQECCGNVKGVSSGHHHSCTFHHVYPDADVHWFHGSHNLTGRSLHNTIKQKGKGGWLTVHSYLERESSDVPYTCSLMFTKTGRYIASVLVQNDHKAVNYSQLVVNGVGSQGPLRTFLCMAVLLAVKLI